MDTIRIFWFRRDLRLDDNTGLYAALKGGIPVMPIFIFDTNILEKLEVNDRRVDFIHQALQDMQRALRVAGSCLHIYEGSPLEVFRKITETKSLEAVYTNHDYEPYARNRDEAVASFLSSKGIAFHTFKDQVLFEKDEVLKPDGKPYSVFTPYSKTWKQALRIQGITDSPSEKHFSSFLQDSDTAFPSLQTIGFEESGIRFEKKLPGDELIRSYDKTRDLPAMEGTTRLGIHLRFGSISVRKCIAIARELNEKFLDELIWREFYQAILWHHPYVTHQSFKPEYDAIPWQHDEKGFEAWCKGLTGYPMVDAGMRQLAQTGWMHNRVRMICASFLCKHLLINWRWGEAWFAGKLDDFELASNNGGWQWAAGCGVDAAPYFRIFNPQTQAEKFDPNQEYIRKWIPELGTKDYPNPVVEHTLARERCLHVYKQALRNNHL